MVAAKKKKAQAKKTQNKTRPGNQSVKAFLENVKEESKREDAFRICKLMEDLSGEKPTMWGSIVGFGQYHYKYASGREGDFMRLGFASRAQNFSLYIMSGFAEYEGLLSKLGKHSTGKSCLYIKRLDDVHLPTLKKLIQTSLRYMKKTYPD